MTSYSISIDYGRGLTHLMDFTPYDENDDLKTPAGELLAALLQLCPSGITLQVDAKVKGH